MLKLCLLFRNYESTANWHCNPCCGNDSEQWGVTVSGSQWQFHTPFPERDVEMVWSTWTISLLWLIVRGKRSHLISGRSCRRPPVPLGQHHTESVKETGEDEMLSHQKTADMPVQYEVWFYFQMSWQDCCVKSGLLKPSTETYLWPQGGFHLQTEKDLAKLQQE